MNLQEENKALKERIAELEEQEKDEQGLPQNGDNYWYINPLGIVLRNEWLDFVSERYMIEIGNIFKTEQDAHFAVEKLKVEGELRKFSKPFVDDNDNYFIQINSYYNCLAIHSNDSYRTQGAIYFESEEKANEAIDTVGEERIEKYLFGVED